MSSLTPDLGRVLIVDDEVELSNALVEILAKQGYQPESATSAEAALDRLRAERFDLLLTDLMMPGTDGIGLLRAARDVDPNLVGIVITGQATVQTAVEAMKGGAVDYILKPFRLQTLLPVLARGREIRRLRDENLQLRETIAIYELSQVVAHSPEPSTIVDKIAEWALQQCEADEASVLLPTSDGRELVVAASRGGEARALGQRAPIHEGIAGWVAGHPEPLVLHGPVDDPRFRPVYPRTDIQSAIVCPLIAGGALVGILTVNRTGSQRRFSLGQGKALSILATVAAAALESASSLMKARQAEEQLRQAQKMEAIGRLAGGIAHDFNNLLTGIIGFGQLLLDELPAERRAHVQEIVAAGERAAELTHQLLAFSRRQPFHPQPVDLNQLVTDLARLLRRVIGEDVHQVMKLAPEIGLVEADSSQLEQVVMNLAVNARDAMPGGGTLTIATMNTEIDESLAARHGGLHPGPCVVLSVSDTGIGMDAEVRARIFEPYFTTKEPGHGTGLGLATVYGIVQRSGGAIDVESKPGQGSTFRIYLPVRRQPVNSAVSQPLARPAPAGSETVLLVEDEEWVRRLARRVLESSGYTVLEADGAERALGLCEGYSGPIHLLLTDVVLPGMSGWELSQRFSAVYPGTRILYMSGYPALPGGGDTNQALEAAGHLQKPFAPEALLTKVREVLDPDRGGA